MNTGISGDIYANLPKEISPKFQLPPITMHITGSILSSCEHCHNIQNTHDIFKVTYILLTHFCTLHKDITNEDDKHYLTAINTQFI